MTRASAVDYLQAANVACITRTCQTASAILVLYDHVITFDREVDHVWTHPSSFGSIMYLLIRYFGDAISILNLIAFLGPGVQTQNLCVFFYYTCEYACIEYTLLRSYFVRGNVYFFVQSWLTILVLFLMQLILQVRLYALYQRSRIVLSLMISGYVCEILAMSVIMIFLGADVQITNEIQPGIYICANTNVPSFGRQYIIWLPVLAYDVLLCVLALWYGISYWTSSYRTERLYGVYIADALVKGNATYCFCIMLACIISIVVGQYLGPEWLEVSQGYPVTMEAIVGCRLTLNLRLLLVREAESECGDMSDDAPWDAFVHPMTSPLLV